MRWPVLVHSARTAVAAVASVLVARLFGLPEAYWAPITTLVITLSSLGAAFTVSWQRFLGTALGAVVGAIVASHFGPHLLVFGACVCHPGIAPRRGSIGSTWVSVRGRYPGDCGVDPTDRSYMANRISSVRRNLHRDWGGANLGVGVAGEGSHTIGEKLNSSFIPSEKDGPWLSSPPFGGRWVSRWRPPISFLYLATLCGKSQRQAGHSRVLLEALMPEHLPRVVIVGGGFGGLAAADQNARRDSCPEVSW